jgi:hypothetical protein
MVAFVYGLLLTIGGILFDAVWSYATRNGGLLQPAAPGSFIAASRDRFFLGRIANAGVMFLSLVAPYAAMVEDVLLVIFYWLPRRGKSRRLDRVDAEAAQDRFGSAATTGLMRGEHRRIGRGGRACPHGVEGRATKPVAG